MQGFSSYLNNISILTYLVVFGAGVATSFTPCVYPLIPIIISIIGTAKEKSRLRNFILSLSYIIGVAVTFSALGMIAALTGRLFGQMQSSPIAHLIVGNVIILFALSLLDVITLPTFLLSKAGAGKVIKSTSLFSVFSMGIASGFVAAPCTVAVLGALLTFVASKQNIIHGILLLFTFAVGLGTLLLLVGVFTGILTGVQKSEKLMKIIQKAMAFGMIALGEYFIFKAGMLSI